jgi:hypothetical protein
MRLLKIDFLLIGSPYRERFSEIILDLQEKGIVSRRDRTKNKQSIYFRFKNRIINGGKVKEHVHQKKKIRKQIHWV